MNKLSNKILAENKILWDNMQNHNFVRQIANNTLPENVFNCYLVYEGNFVLTAVDILAFGIAKAPDLARKKRLATGINDLIYIQLDWFQKVYQKRHIQIKDFFPANKGYSNFKNGMRDVAENGDYADIITTMFMAEWMYYHWCKAVSKENIQNREIKEWVDMHTTDAFLNQAKWLKNEVDIIEGTVTAKKSTQLSMLYGKAMQWEIDFHYAAWQ